jgi:hypothetical protein
MREFRGSLSGENDEEKRSEQPAKIEAGKHEPAAREETAASKRT